MADFSSDFSITGGTFATFDPRIDGLDAPINTSWAPSDCPIRLIKIGDAATAWDLAAPGEEIFSACRSAAEVNALYQGLARHPELDFSPVHLPIPDHANSRITDMVGGDHLTKQGLGAGASIERSPMGDGLGPLGYRAEQLHNNASYYAAADATKYVVTTGAFVAGFVASTTRHAAGAKVIGKYANPALAGKGWAVTFNGDGRFGFLQNGALADLNVDNTTCQRIDDGRPRLWHTGRSVLGAGLAFARSAGVSASVVGKAGDLTTNVATPFGLLNDDATTKLAMGSIQWQAIAFWTGTAAENVVAYMDAIEAGLASTVPAVAGSLLSAPVVATPARTIDGAAFQPNPLRSTLCTYAINYGGAQDTGYVKLLCDAANPPTTEWGRVGAGCSVAIITIVDGVLTCVARPGDYVKLVKVIVAGAPTLTLTAQHEVSL